MAGATSIPIIGGLFDDTDERAMAELARNRELYEGIDVPNLTWQDLAPELYTNETANYELTSEDPIIRSRQMDHLAKLAGLADNGLSDVDAAGFDKARQIGAQSARAGREASMADAAARGVAGSGLEFASREIANQAGADRAHEAALQQAAESARQRALYEQAYGSALGGVRSQDLAANQANTDIINRFNQANTAQRNQTNAANTDLRNNTQATNQQGRRDVAQQNFNNQMTRANGIAGANTQVANGYGAQNAANTAERNMWTGIAAQAGLAAYGAGGKKKPSYAGESNTDYSAYV
jgi:hypothetical protein